jgi:hypothetical protein
MKNEVARLEAQRDSGVQDVTTQLQELAPTMIEVIERLAIYGSKESIRLQAAQDLLDRNKETSKVTKVDSVVTHETHEQRLARLMGVSPDEVYGKSEGNKEINITPTAQTMSTSINVEAEAAEISNEEHSSE